MPILVHSLPCVILPCTIPLYGINQKKVRKSSQSKRHGSHMADKEKLRLRVRHIRGQIDDRTGTAEK
jgi:hypothetical protein